MLGAKESPKITAYIRAAMSTAVIKKLEDGTYYSEIPSCAGVWANEHSEDASLKILQEVLEEWIILKLRDNDPIPVINNIQLKRPPALSGRRPFRRFR